MREDVVGALITIDQWRDAQQEITDLRAQVGSIVTEYRVMNAEGRSTPAHTLGYARGQQDIRSLFVPCHIETRIVSNWVKLKDDSS